MPGVSLGMNLDQGSSSEPISWQLQEALGDTPSFTLGGPSGTQGPVQVPPQSSGG